MVPNPDDERPAALYLDLEGLDVTPGHDLLRLHGVDVLRVEDEPAVPDLNRVVALMVGYDRVGPDLLDRLPALRMVATHSVGCDMVEVEDLRRRGLWLANLPCGATDEVAVHALAMALSLIRRLPHYDHDVRDGQWIVDGTPLPRLPMELTLGVVGLGRIGRALARMSAGLFGGVVGHDPVLAVEHWPEGVRHEVALDELLGRCDVVSLHLPLTMETRRLMDARRLALLPDHAILVNVSRGGLVCEEALLAALGSGRLAGAACDVLVHEPPGPDDPMLHQPGVLLSPHVAYLSASSRRRYAELPARNVVALLEDGAPLTPAIRPCEPEGSSAPSPARGATTPRRRAPRRAGGSRPAPR